MGTSENDSEKHEENDVDQPTSESLFEKFRNAGAAGYVLLGALLLAVVVVVVSLVDGNGDSQTVQATDVSTTTEVEGTVASEDPLATEPTVAIAGDRAALRSAIDDFEQCLRDRGLAVRVRSASESGVEIGLRGDGDLDAVLADPALEECSELHLDDFDMTVTVSDGSQEDDTPDTSIPESTDGSTPPTQPTTDTTAP